MKNDYYDSDEFKEILNTYEAAQAGGKQQYFDVDDYADVADYYLNNDKTDQCLKCLEQGLKLHPDEPQLLSIMSGAYIFLHKYKKAEKILDRMSADDGDDVLYQRAQLEYALYHDTARAEEMFTEWIAIQREYREDDSEEEDETRREEIFRDAYVHVITSFIELTPKHNYDEELVKRWIEDYLVTFSPLGDYDSDLILADTVREEGLFDMIVKVYSNILETNPYVNYGWTVLAAAQYSCDMYEEALESADFALAINPQDWDSVLTKAHALYSTYRYDLAIPFFEQYIANTGDTSQHLPYAICLINAERKAEALEQLKKAEKFYSRFSEDKEYYATSCYEIADAYLALERISEAERFVDIALKLFPHNGSYQLLKGTILLAHGDYQHAMGLFVGFIESMDDIVEATLLVVIRLMLFELEVIAIELIDTVEKFGKRSPKLRNLYPYKALASLRVGRFDDFMSYLKKSQRLCPELTERVLHDLFPEGMKAKDYYKYMTDNLALFNQ